MITVFVLILTLFKSDLSAVDQYSATQHMTETGEKIFYTSMNDCEKWKKVQAEGLDEQSDNGKNFKYVLGCFELPWDPKQGSI